MRVRIRIVEFGAEHNDTVSGQGMNSATETSTPEGDNGLNASMVSHLLIQNGMIHAVGETSELMQIATNRNVGSRRMLQIRAQKSRRTLFQYPECTMLC